MQATALEKHLKGFTQWLNDYGAIVLVAEKMC